MIVKHNEPLDKHCTFGIGGNAKIAYFPENISEFCDILKQQREMGERYLVVGNGSNLLFDDNGFDGAIVFTKGMSAVEYTYKSDCVYIYAECGKLLTGLSYEAGKKHSLTGLEFAYGIPATVGGAVFMNAGAYGGQMSDIVVSTLAFDMSRMETVIIDASAHNFAYRHSVFEENNNLIVLATTLCLHNGDLEQICEKMDANMQSRRDKQPLEYPSAGSTFKRPEGYFAAKLIDDCNLKGYTVGGAQVSKKHAGFTVNIGTATSADVLKLISHVKNTVLESFGVELNTEIIYIPYN